jgi:hypothetical protein
LDIKGNNREQANRLLENSVDLCTIPPGPGQVLFKKEAAEFERESDMVNFLLFYFLLLDLNGF